MHVPLAEIEECITSVVHIYISSNFLDHLLSLTCILRLTEDHSLFRTLVLKWISLFGRWWVFTPAKQTGLEFVWWLSGPTILKTSISNRLFMFNQIDTEIFYLGLRSDSMLVQFLFNRSFEGRFSWASGLLWLPPDRFLWGFLVGTEENDLLNLFGLLRGLINIPWVFTVNYSTQWLSVGAARYCNTVTKRTNPPFMGKNPRGGSFAQIIIISETLKWNVFVCLWFPLILHRRIGKFGCLTAGEWQTQKRAIGTNSSAAFTAFLRRTAQEVCSRLSLSCSAGDQTLSDWPHTCTHTCTPAHMHAPKLPPPNEHVVLLLSKHVITARCQPSCRPASTFSLFFSLPAALLYDHIIDGGETPRGRSYRLTFLMVFSAYCKGAVYGSAVWGSHNQACNPHNIFKGTTRTWRSSVRAADGDTWETCSNRRARHCWV